MWAGHLRGHLWGPGGWDGLTTRQKAEEFVFVEEWFDMKAKFRG